MSIASTHAVFVVVILVTGSVNSISVQYCNVLLRVAAVSLKHAHSLQELVSGPAKFKE